MKLKILDSGSIYSKENSESFLILNNKLKEIINCNI